MLIITQPPCPYQDFVNEDNPADMLPEKLRIALAERGEITVELKQEIR